MPIPHNMNTGLDQSRDRVQASLKEDMERREKERYVTLSQPVYDELRSAAAAGYAGYGGSVPPPPSNYDTMQSVAAAGAINASVPPDTELASRARDILKSSQRIVDRLSLALIRLRGENAPETGATAPYASGLLFDLALTQELQQHASVALDELETLI